MAEQVLRFVGGEKGDQTVYIQHDDGTAYNLTGYNAPVIFVRDSQERDAGDNVVDGEALTVDDATTGACTWSFDFSAYTGDSLSGHWRCKLVKADGSVVRYTARQPFHMEKDVY